MANSHQQQVRIFLGIILLFITSQLTTQSCSEDNDLYVIRSAAQNGLVLDATDPKKVVIQHYTGFRPQLWRFERTPEGNLIYIVNNYTGQPLDVVKDSSDEHHYLVTSERKNVLRQQWNLTLKGRIMHAETEKNLDVPGANFTAGNRLILWKENGNLAQAFVFQKKL